MNSRTASLLLASLLTVAPAAAAPSRRAKPRTTPATAPAASTSASTSDSTSAQSSTAPSSSSESLAAPAQSTAASTQVSVPAASTAARSSAVSSTGRLYAGAYAGVLVGGDAAPNLGLQVAGPILLQGLPPNLHLEWLAALDFAFSSTSETVPFGGEVEGSAFNVSLLPGARIVVPVVPQLLLHGDLSFGLAFSHASASVRVSGIESSQSNSDVGVVFRLAAGAIIPVNERLRFNVTPLALQTYAPGGTSWSVQVGLSYALD